MLIYLVAFLLSTILLYIGSIQESKQLKRLFVLLGMLVVCLLAGFRDESVGTDIRWYSKRLFQGALDSRSWIEYFNLYNHYETGYLFLNYVVSRFSKSLGVMHFVIEFIICFNVYYAYKTIGKESEAWYGMLIYYFVYYNQSFNLMRQTISCSFIFLAFAFLKKKKYVISAVLIGVGILFHVSSFIAVIAVVLFILSSKFEKEIRGIIIISSVLFYVIGRNLIGRLLVSLTFLSSQFSSYFSSSYKYDIPYSIFIYLIIATVFSIVILKNTPSVDDDESIVTGMSNERQWNNFLLLMALVSTILMPFLSSIMLLWRSLLSFNFITMYTYENVDSRLNILVSGRNITRHIVIARLIIYWVMYTIIYNNNNTIPYKFGTF